MYWKATFWMNHKLEWAFFVNILCETHSGWALLAKIKLNIHIKIHPKSIIKYYRYWFKYKSKKCSLIKEKQSHRWINERFNIRRISVRIVKKPNNDNNKTSGRVKYENNTLLCLYKLPLEKTARVRTDPKIVTLKRLSE